MTTDELEQLPLSELRKLALQQEAQPDPQQAPQPRDEQGRFAKQYQDTFETPAEPVETTAEITDSDVADEEPEEYIYRREIDLGDGAGVRVYYGKGESKEEALEQLADHLAEAQKNAAKTIHDFQKKYPKEPEKPKVREFSPDEEYVYSQEFMTKPTEAFKKLFKETTGYGIEDFQSKLQAADAWEKSQRSLAVQENFVATHSDYVRDLSNADKMKAWVQTHGHTEFTEDNLEKAYQDLKKSGLLKLKAEGADVATDTEGAGTERTVQPKQDMTQQRSQKKGSTISSKGRSTAQMQTEPSEDELYDPAKYPLDKLRTLANQQLTKVNQG